MSKFTMPLYNVKEYKIMRQYQMCQTSLEESVLRIRMTIGTTDGRCTSSNVLLIHDQQHIYFISLNGLIEFVSSLARNGIDSLLRKIGARGGVGIHIWVIRAESVKTVIISTLGALGCQVRFTVRLVRKYPSLYLWLFLGL